MKQLRQRVKHGITETLYDGGDDPSKREWENWGAHGRYAILTQDPIGNGEYLYGYYFASDDLDDALEAIEEPLFREPE